MNLCIYLKLNNIKLYNFIYYYVKIQNEILIIILFIFLKKLKFNF